MTLLVQHIAKMPVMCCEVISSFVTLLFWFYRNCPILCKGEISAMWGVEISAHLISSKSDHPAKLWRHFDFPDFQSVATLPPVLVLTVLVLRMSKFIRRPNFDEVSQFIAGILLLPFSKNAHHIGMLLYCR